MESKEKVTRILLITVATALVGAIFSFCVGLVLASNQYRMSIARDEAARLTRQINLLILLRDELARMRDGIDHGDFQIKTDGEVLQSPGYEWPTQIWNTLKWNNELLSVEPSLVQLLANTYNEVVQAEKLRSETAQSVNGNGRANIFLEVMMRSMNAPASEIKKVRSDPQFEASMKAYVDVQTRIQQKLPPTIAALDIKINELQARMKTDK